MKEKENMDIAFMGGSIDIRAQGSFVNQKTGELVEHCSKVILSYISDDNDTWRYFLNIFKCTKRMISSCSWRRSKR
ncbi:hypothetical protein [Methanolobus sp. ZRKC5]|uniref:hypothetical protein n=1 Tax=unclassified Methanolobus TaxID=2629569 RepID=UPI00313C310A